MLNSAEHEVEISRNSAFIGPKVRLECYFVVGILTFMTRKTFMLSRVDHGERFISSDPG